MYDRSRQSGPMEPIPRLVPSLSAACTKIQPVLKFRSRVKESALIECGGGHMCDSKYNFASFSLSRARAFSFFAVCWQCLQCFIANSHLNAPDNTIVSRMLLSSSVYLSRALAFLPPPSQWLLSLSVSLAD